MKILILGSDGQIGSALTTHLKNLKYEVVDFDIFSNTKNDLREPNILNNILPDTDFVFFLAFDVGGSAYLKEYQDSFIFISNNIKIMNNTFDSLKKYKTPFIFTSSQMSNMSYSSYGILKHIGEKYTHCLNGKIVKLWNVYGYERNLIKSHVITDFILSAKNNKIINMRTNGKESRQFLYSDDCGECLEILMNKFYELTEIEYDVTNFEWTSILDIANIIARNFPNTVINIGEKSDELQKNALREPSTDILRYWQPKTSINKGIKKIIEMENKKR